MRLLPTLLLLLSALPALAAEPQIFRISLDTGPNHLRNHVVERFAESLRAAAGGRLDVQVFHSGQLGKGRDVPKALIWGSAHMGVPVMQHLARYVPDANLFGLPVFYGAGSDAVWRLAETSANARIIQTVERKLRVKVLVPYLELGETTLFTSHPVRSPADYAGLKIRSIGGAAVPVRLRRLGANPVTLPFADVPLALGQGALDGIISTYESVRSGQLWQVGLNHAFEDRGEAVLYAPMVGLETWRALPPDLRRAVQSAWAEAAADSRALSARRQASAREAFIAAGGAVARADAAQLAALRRRIRADAAELLRELHMSPALLSAALGEGDARGAPPAHR